MNNNVFGPNEESGIAPLDDVTDDDEIRDPAYHPHTLNDDPNGHVNGR